MHYVRSEVLFYDFSNSSLINTAGEVRTVDRRGGDEGSIPEGRQEAEPLSMEGREADTTDAVDQQGDGRGSSCCWLLHHQMGRGCRERVPKGRTEGSEGSIQTG